MQHGEDNVHVNCTVAGAAGQSLGLKRPREIRLGAAVPAERRRPGRWPGPRLQAWLRGLRPADGTGRSAAFPCSNSSASPAVSQRPSLVMPMGTTSNLLLSMALTTDAAESSETSCSPLRPPKRMPTRSFFIVFIGLRRPLPFLHNVILAGLSRAVPKIASATGPVSVARLDFVPGENRYAKDNRVGGAVVVSLDRLGHCPKKPKAAPHRRSASAGTGACTCAAPHSPPGNRAAPREEARSGHRLRLRYGAQRHISALWTGR